ncbi:MAG TPA: toxin, partial [Chloroflexota bacterium]
MMKDATQVGFHNIQEASQAAQTTSTMNTQFTYTFENFFHPYVGELIGQLNTGSLAGLLDPNYQQSLSQDFFTNYYPLLLQKAGQKSQDIQVNYFPKEIDVHNDGPYANYNWELLFHIPLTVAVHLSKNQRFAEAQRWFHYIFDPTSNDTSIPTPQRFWKFLRFRQNTDVQQIGDLLALLSKPDNECTP